MGWLVRRCRVAAAALCVAAALGCGPTITSTPVRFADATGTPGEETRAPLELEGFAACTGDQPDAIALEPDQPLVVIVHGCFSSGSQFERLAEVFEFHGQQALCFNYDYRRTLRAAAVHLQDGLERLRRALPGQRITVLAHSQGGLVSRIALSMGEAPPAEAGDLRLVTVSSPFSGIDAARHCGWAWLHVVSLDFTTAVCQAVTGANWVEIHPRSTYWREPRPLHPAVSEHLQIVTDEAGTCRRRDEEGACVEDDLVFSTDEQENARMAADERVHVRVLPAGHAAVVGGGGRVPRALVGVLQEHEVLAPTPPEREGELSALLRRLYARF